MSINTLNIVTRGLPPLSLEPERIRYSQGHDKSRSLSWSMCCFPLALKG